MKPTAFLSYSHHDTALVDQLHHDLQLLGLDVWRDLTHITLSQDIPRVLEKAIARHADIFIVALTNNSIASQWVEWERTRAEEAAESGWPLGVVYVKLDAKTHVPNDIKNKRFVDLSSRSQGRRYRELLALAKYCLARRPFARIGVYDIYESYADMDTRREDADGEPGCNIERFVESTQCSLIAVGYWFSNLFGSDSGRAVGLLLTDNEDVQVDLYIPDPDSSPLQYLADVHETREGVVQRIRTFIDYFKSWGKMRRFTAAQARRCTLHLLNVVPMNSFLCVDAETAKGRMIVHPYATGIQPSLEMKIELRYPKTSTYRMYYESLMNLRRPERETGRLYPLPLEAEGGTVSGRSQTTASGRLRGAGSGAKRLVEGKS